MKRQQKFRVLPTPEFLYVVAKRTAPRIGSYGWRPTQADINQLRDSTGSAPAYKATMRAWRRAGLKVHLIKKLAGRGR
jgi:hypothetical protein